MASLIGVGMPDVELPSTWGGSHNPAMAQGRAVYFVYPYSGRPGVPDPEGWDHIPGAHGSTPQARAYAMLQSDFSALHTRVYGLSLQDSAWQREFAERAGLPFPLLSDVAGSFARSLNLETFSAGARCFLQRRTLVALNGRIAFDKEAFALPESDAAEVLAWMKA